jgi:hypothetical protein
MAERTNCAGWGPIDYEADFTQHDEFLSEVGKFPRRIAGLRGDAIWKFV